MAKMNLATGINCCDCSIGIMRILKQLFFTVCLVFFISISTDGKVQHNGLTPVKEIPTRKNHKAGKLLEYLKKKMDSENTREFPAVMSAEKVLESLNEKTLVIDMRSREMFSEGHIPGAINVGLDSINRYFATEIRPDEYEKIVLACYSGQSASYAASLLYLQGYRNVFPMLWGMCAWNQEISNHWEGAVSSEYTDLLEKTVNHGNSETVLPVLTTRKKSGMEILKERVEAVSHEYGEASITAEKVFSNPGKYYIIYCDRKEKYDSGHIPGAVWYSPEMPGDIASIPPDKEIVVYSDAGHKSAMVTAFLRVLGYNAKNLRYGSNSFMNDKMCSEKDQRRWLSFTNKEVKDFPLDK